LWWQEKILAEVEEQVDQLLAMVFERNHDWMRHPLHTCKYFCACSSVFALVLVPILQLNTLLWRLNAPFKTISKFEDSTLLWQQKRIAKQISNGSNGFLMDSLSNGIAYVKMKTLCLHISNSKCAWTLRFLPNMFCLGQKHQSFIKFSNFDDGICNATIQHTI